jgi:hypothetical protein
VAIDPRTSFSVHSLNFPKAVLIVAESLLLQASPGPPKGKRPAIYLAVSTMRHF